jgi:hypothetical protein
MGGGNIHLDWMGQGEGPWMDGVNQIRNPQSAIRNRKGPSENPFPWQAPEGSIQLFGLKSFKARDSPKIKGNFLSCQDKYDMNYWVSLVAVDE